MEVVDRYGVLIHFLHIILVCVYKLSNYSLCSQLIRRNLPNPMGIAVHMGDVYWVDRNLGTVFKASKFPGNSSLPISVRTNLPRLRDISIFDALNQPNDENNPCLHLGNGGCEQLCFSFPLDLQNPGKPPYKCDCATGELSTVGNGRKCTRANEYLVFSTRTEIRGINLDPHATTIPFTPLVSFYNVSVNHV